MDSSYLANAIAECEQAITTKLNNPEDWQAAFRTLGNLLQGMGEFERAIVWHSLALESKLNLAEVYFQLGELHILEKNWSAALASMENASEYLPNSDRIYAALAQINGQLQRKDAETDYWYRATQINPNLLNAQGYYKLAKALGKRGKITEAIACYELATADGKGVVAAFFELGEIYLRQGKLDLAQAVYQKILAAEPTEARARYKLGNIYLQKRSFDQAIDCFRLSIKHDPDFPWSYRDLVKTFLLLQRWDEAISTCYAILNLVGEYPWVYIHLGNALRERGRLAEAAANFQKACEHRGWQQCVTKDYFFTIDVFSHRISSWTEYLRPLMAATVNALEVGCYQGMSCCWMLDQLLTPEHSRLTCIDNNFERLLQENVAKTGSKTKVTFLEGNSHQLMANLTPNSFDLISLQDRCRLTEHTEQNAMFAWKLLKPGGFIVFSYYGWRNPNDARQNPRAGIDQFLDSVKGQWQPVHFSPPAFQLIIRKL
ncbi:tetratricopeptide repeat protein [Pleurocapsales cyanobacterium LEGE 10410]|nr:tetratricopeptide repeat protein [Pleurocapsales cyanobacterium LEGE 10410]